MKFTLNPWAGKIARLERANARLYQDRGHAIDVMGDTVERLIVAGDRLRSERDAARAHIEDLTASNERLQSRCDALEGRCARIAGMETEKCASMAAVARGDA